MASLATVLKSVLFCGVLLLSLRASRLLAQGSLTPPGSPAPTMKSLDQVQPRTPISSVPYTISSPGSYYLTTNLTGIQTNMNGITVSSGNVVIDLNGFALSGNTNTFSGIYVAGNQTNVMVRNGTISGWGASGIDGYSYGPPANLLFEHLVCSGNAHYGLGVGPGGQVHNCSCMNNGWGGLDCSGNTLITGCSFSQNTNSGASGVFDYGGGDLLIRDSQFYRNNYGMVVYGQRCELHNCQINSNMNDGIFISYNNVSSNVSVCASLFSGCSIIGNGGNGFDITGGNNNIFNGGSPMLIWDCLIVGNGFRGAYLDNCPGSKVSNCSVTGNGFDGIYVQSDNSFITGNTFSGNNASANTNYAGITVFANQCRFEDNHFNNNGYAGFAIRAGAGNVVVKNTFGDAYYFGSTGNYIGPVGNATNATSPWANLFD